jgi:hypothetical protein
MELFIFARFHARAGNEAGIDRLFDSNVAVACAFGFNITERGEALFERSAHGDGSARGAEGRRVFQDVHVVAAFGRIFSLQEDVGVGIDEAGQNGGFGEIDNGGVGRDLRGGGIAHALDTVAADDDHLVAADGIRFSIN